MSLLDPEEVHKRKYAAKFDILFDKLQSHWMVTDPKEGALVYPCYACRAIFSTKSSFIDHVNRLSVGLKYDCPECSATTHFYNPCSLLLHARQHFNLTQGSINLDRITIHLLPEGTIGFPPNPDIPLIYNDDEDLETSSPINSSFYIPIGVQEGNTWVKLAATHLVFCNNKVGANRVTLMLKQVCSNIPKCVFIVTKDGAKSNKTETNAVEVISDEKISEKRGRDGQVICTECNTWIAVNRKPHFQQGKKPRTYIYQCNMCEFAAPGRCAFKAHKRLHFAEAPFVCPECGEISENFLQLVEHQESNCFHFSKFIKIQCSSRHCWKSFVYHASYKQHLRSHMQSLIECIVCIKEFTSDEYIAHASQEHKGEKVASLLKYKCDLCNDLVLPQEDYQKHINFHCDPKHVNNLIYVYICKYCRSFFRTPINFSNHQKTCKKTVRLSELVSMRYSPVMTYCSNCGFLVLLKVDLDCCPKCKDSENLFQSKGEFGLKKTQCQRCNNRLFTHTEHRCTFKKAVVVLKNLGDISSTVLIPSDHTYDLNSKRMIKRKKKSTPSPNKKTKKPESSDLPEESQDGDNDSFSCKSCDYSSPDRQEFRKHVATHHEESIYRCMECGESFVVKSSFEKHLIFFHRFTDVDKYIVENQECYNKELAERFENGGEGPLEENQCEVCRAKFEDEFELKKHVRVHGMAFLLSKSKTNEK